MLASDETDPACWYACRVRPRHEKAVAQALTGKGLENLLPLCREQRKWSDRSREVREPLFPGYVFCRFEAARKTPVLATPGVIDIVRFGSRPAPVDPNEISAIQKAMEANLWTEPGSYFESGEEVLVIEGPLCGIRGIYLSHKNTGRLVLRMTLLRRSVLVEIDRSCVVPVRVRPAAFGRPA